MLKASYQKHPLQFIITAGTSRGYISEKPSWIISMHDTTDTHVKGLGECSLIPGLSPDPQNEYEETLAKICSNPEYYLPFTNHELNSYPSIRFGLEMAFADLKNGGRGILFKSDFTSGDEGIPINGLIWMGSKQDMFQQIKSRVEEGFSCIKLKIGTLDFEEELALLKQVRRDLKPADIELRVDANGSFSPQQALEKLKRLSDYALHSIEQPIKAGHWEMMAHLCSASPVPVALDEELFATGTKINKRNLLQTIRPKYLALKPSMLGGFAKSSEWITEAKSLGIEWWITSALESNIGLNALAQWTYTLGNPAFHGLGTGKLFVNNFQTGLYIEKGLLRNNPHKNDIHGVSTMHGSSFLEQWNQGAVFFTFHTSGSTGKPKQILVSRQSMIRSAQITGKALGLSEGETALLCLPLEFVAGKMMLVRTLVLNLKLIVVKPASNPLRQLDSGSIIDFAAMTPVQVHECLKDPDSTEKIRRMKCLIIGGTPLGKNLENQLQQFTFPIYETYGMTETLSHIALRRVNGNERSDFFNLLPGINIKTDHRGCLLIHAPHLDQPNVITNDVVELTNPQQFRWLGRADNVINSGGIKVFPEQVEQKLEGLISRRFIIIGLPDEALGQKVALVIEGLTTDDLQDLRGIFESKLTNFEKPREIRFIDKFPETLGGKIRYDEIRKLLL